jgi:hypothetical protein
MAKVNFSYDVEADKCSSSFHCFTFPTRVAQLTALSESSDSSPMKQLLACYKPK